MLVPFFEALTQYGFDFSAIFADTTLEFVQYAKQHFRPIAPRPKVLMFPCFSALYTYLDDSH